MTNDRYGSVRFGTVRRLIDAALRNGRSVQVWACGEVNRLTELAPQQSDTAADCCSAAEPCCSGGEPTTAEEIGDLVAANEGRFTWLACQTCSDGRGAGEHIPGLPTPSFSDLRDYVDKAAKTVFIGGV
ncbi:MAG TPA: hypothetical protein VFW65_14280 [Pseudonocardiaceae bacterium]|nr:hypothetical protein [Pseudonocardiaceae bacterium]